MTKRFLTGALLLGALLGASSCSTRPPHAEPSTIAVVPIQADAGAPAPAASAHESDEEGAASPRETRLIAQTLAKVERLRGVAATRPVPGVTLPRSALVAKVKEKALREVPVDALRREGLALQLLGFAPPELDYLTAMLQLLEQQLDGFYEPANGTMYLARELRGEWAKAALAHELVHALQDQRWDLRSRSKYTPGRGDETMARAALAEGDASSLMLDFAAPAGATALVVGDETLREMMREAANDEALAHVPKILRATLIAPYAEGIVFVNHVRRSGGWPGVNAAWDRIPTTTEQILHPEKWFANEPALVVPAPTARALGAGFQRDDEDTYGELGLMLAFGEWMPDAEARRVAAGWGGDRSAMFSRGDEVALALHVRYDRGATRDGELADAAFAALTPALRRLGAATLQGDVICLERTLLGPLAIGKRDRELVITLGPARVNGTRWASSSTCATARAWVAEIAKQ